MASNGFFWLPIVWYCFCWLQMANMAPMATHGLRWFKGLCWFFTKYLASIDSWWLPMVSKEAFGPQECRFWCQCCLGVIFMGENLKMHADIFFLCIFWKFLCISKNGCHGWNWPGKIWNFFWVLILVIPSHRSLPPAIRETSIFYCQANNYMIMTTEANSHWTFISHQW